MSITLYLIITRHDESNDTNINAFMLEIKKKIFAILGQKGPPLHLKMKFFIHYKYGYHSIRPDEL